MTDSQPSDYDAYEYESQPYADSRPEHCALVARLRGFPSPALSKYRCLEIGCSSGNNILPLATLSPTSSFVAVDAAHSNIERAEQLRLKLGLSNIEFHTARFEDLGTALGTFDYIICHGVLSWIPVKLQPKLFSFCATSLNDGGILYLSYNTYPGWHVREIVRNALMFHTAALPPSDAKVDQAKQFASFMSQYVQGIEFPNTDLVRNEFRKASQLPGWYLLHDLLEGENVPLYFSDVVQAAFDEGLGYVGDAELGMMFPQEFSQDVRKKLYTIGSTPEMLEQYLDFMRMRTFRKSIFFKGAVEGSKQLESQAIADTFLGTPFKRKEHSTRVRSSSVVEFTNARGDTYETSDPTVLRVLALLSSAAPKYLASSELFKDAEILKNSPKIDDFHRTLLRLYLEGIVDLSLIPTLEASSAGELPRGYHFARAQAEIKNEVINLKHEVVALDDLSRNILLLADGTRSRAQIAEELEKRGVRALRDGIKVPLSEAVDITLRALAGESLIES